MQLKLITIDFWDTLFSVNTDALMNQHMSEFLITTLNNVGIAITEEDANDLTKRAWAYYKDKWQNEHRTPPVKEILNAIWTFPTNEKAFNYIVDYYENMIFLCPPDLEPDAHSSLIELSSKYKLAMVSDTGFSTGKIVNDLLTKLDIKKYFSAFSYSDETGVAKPHPRAFTTILEQLNIKAEESLHIGDIERTDIKGAKSVGMRAIRYVSSVNKIAFEVQDDNTEADYIAHSWKEIVDYLMKD